MKKDSVLQEKHTQYMQKALRQAYKAAHNNEVPIGAVIVSDKGKIVARAYNQVEKLNTQAAHAEVLAISKAGKKLGDWRLNGCWIYVTLEPCSMCFNLILLSRLSGIVFGAPSPLFGYQLDRVGTVSIYKNRNLPLHVVDEVCAQESAQLLKQFFKKRRKESD